MLAGAASAVLAGAVMRHHRGEPAVQRQRPVRRRRSLLWGPVIAALMRKTHEAAHWGREPTRTQA
jgi:hypothetical protein